VLEYKQTRIAAERSTGKEPLTDADARQLLAAAEKVIVARGKSRRELAADDAKLDDLKGPTGSYRAPILVVGTTLVVGFDPTTLDDLL